MRMNAITSRRVTAIIFLAHTVFAASMAFGQASTASQPESAAPQPSVPSPGQLLQMRKEGKQLSAADQARLKKWEIAHSAQAAKQAAAQRVVNERAEIAASMRQYEAAGLSPEQAFALAAAERDARAKETQGAAGKTFDIRDRLDKQTQAACGLSLLAEAETGRLSAEVFKLIVESFHLGQMNPGPPRETDVAVIGPSLSTAQFAKAIVARLNLNEVKPKRASRVLVVVRSSLNDPLQNSYRSFGELTRDAELQLNISGPKYHAYLFRLDDDLSVTQVEHSAQDVGN